MTSLGLKLLLLAGKLPSEIGLMTDLQSFRLNNMLQFVGDIPTETGKLTHLKLLDLSCTDFQTPLPTELARLSGLDVIWNCSSGYYKVR